MRETPYTIAVLSGKGGVGKTTLALNLSRELSRYARVWLVDIDLFNRGATSALWESEKEIPLSVAALVNASTSLADRNKYLKSGEPDKLRRAYVTELRKHLKVLAYDERLAFLPAARATEGRAASYLLWKGFSEQGATASATLFLRSLLQALNETTPGCIVILDGHGGLDDLSLGAAEVSDLCYIVNEPDLITFTGSLTLYREIRDAQPGKDLFIEFIINRVPPNRSIHVMERDFGDVLASMSKSARPVAAYFPLERELFGVFGDDPFVYEIYTRFWFSRKIRMLGEAVIEHGLATQRLRRDQFHQDAPPIVTHAGGPAAPVERARDRVRYAVRREFHKRGDLLLMCWLGFSSIALGVVYAFTTYRDNYRQTTTNLGIAASLLAVILIVQTLRYVRVQMEHVGNASRLRGAPGRRLRFGASRSAELRKTEELRRGKTQIRKNLVRAAIAATILTIAGFILVPRVIEAAGKAKQTRTMESMRTIATALEAHATDVNFYPPVDSIDELKPILVPTYLKEPGFKSADEWATPMRYWTADCREGSNTAISGREFSSACNTYAFGSAGADKTFDTPYLENYYPNVTTKIDDDLIFSNGNFLRSPETVPPNAKQTTTMSVMLQVASAIESYKRERNSYPDAQAFETLYQAPVADGWGTRLRYKASGCDAASVCQTYRLASAGADQQFERENLDEYTRGGTTKFEEDLVLADGRFIRAPQAPFAQ